MFACPWKGSPFLSSFPLSSLLPSREMEGSQTCNAKYFTNILLFNHQTTPCEAEGGGLARPRLPSWEAARAAVIFSLLLSRRPPPPPFPSQLLNSHPETRFTNFLNLCRKAQILEAQRLGVGYRRTWVLVFTLGGRIGIVISKKICQLRSF